MSWNIKDARIAIIGLGYVGLPLAIEFGKKFPVIGFDIHKQRVMDLNQGIDSTQEANLADLSFVLSAQKEGAAFGLTCGYDLDTIKDCNVYIITVPTPINQFKAPDLKPLLQASTMIAKVLKEGDVVIYESTVYPGCTEEDCVPILAEFSNLTYNTQFFVGYSPERINPGDKINTLTKIMKVTSGSTPEVATYVDDLYKAIITAGTHKAPNLKVAEASKAIENAQRDVNISFVNELALIFDRVGIDTQDVLAAASTKWNFLNYKPGLVGGHCIGVDPYYLAHKAESLGYHPQVILSGRRVNDQMGSFVADKVVKLMIQNDLKIKNADVLILGITFKENCPDVRNTRVIDIHEELSSFGLSVDIYDPWADEQVVLKEYNLKVLKQLIANKKYKAIVLAVAHKEFLTLDFNSLKEEDGILYDTKACLPREIINGRL